MKYLLMGATALALVACSQENQAPSADETTLTKTAETEMAVDETDAAKEPTAWERLDTVLAAQSDDAKARYQYRHPAETLKFFGIKPGMTVVDTLPGEVWYTGILLDYLGEDGKVIGADYSPEMWSLFGSFAPPEGAKANWAAEWTEKAEGWRDEGDAAVGAFAFGSVPDDMAGTVDVVLQIRSMHHFNRFEDQGGYRSQAIADMYKLLKPGGIVGVVQHRAPESNDDAWANGDNGYVKQSAIVAAFEAGGFDLADQSEINANPKDQPTESDFVWRLPPTLATSGDDPEAAAAAIAIGESDRMTLKFKKPE
ncbi:class I SAM-dependent methyltransferase [Hyphococcus sp. DH-69]|uniref:class I SAM-dependent methyltransferase n=1 Tax=Hyphococcus formosus TaxID=3143534 RepID=UPI00398AAEDE